jgi:hypothetical protein
MDGEPEVFRDLEPYLPSTRTPRCASEYQRLAHAFRKVIDPHVDPEMEPALAITASRSGRF